MASIGTICGFWRAAGHERWFGKDDAFDADMRARFLKTHYAAARREMDPWASDAEGVLALMVLLDQFPRNAFRGTAHMYATDALARHYAGRAIEAGLDRRLEPQVRVFLYLPFSHSENLDDQDRAVVLNAPLGGIYEKSAISHREIVRRFGRFPHRNPMLGRATTPDEQEYLDGGGFSG